MGKLRIPAMLIQSEEHRNILDSIIKPEIRTSRDLYRKSSHFWSITARDTN
jgi:hypothetical protein